MIVDNCEEMIHAYYDDYKFFFSKPNVTGIALGYKITNGITTSIPCIQVFVINKLAKNRLEPNCLIPTLYKGIKTDIIETGKFIAGGQNSLSNAPGPYTGRIRPIEPSYSISSTYAVSSLTAGTFGYIVLDNQQASKTYCLLSNNKTFAALNKAPIGSLIIQPALSYGGRTSVDTVAKLLKYINIAFDSNIPENIQSFNTTDASVASYFNVGEIQLINPHIPRIGIPRGITNPSLLQSIKWTGCNSGHKKGTVVSTKAIVKVDYELQRLAWFKDVIACGGEVLQKGDEGALVCDFENKALGLLFASSQNLNIVCPITTIQNKLKVTLLTL